MYYKLNTCPLLPLDLITTSHPTIVSLSFSHDDKFQEPRNWGQGRDRATETQGNGN